MTVASACIAAAVSGYKRRLPPDYIKPRIVKLGKVPCWILLHHGPIRTVQILLPFVEDNNGPRGRSEHSARID